jgi:hypothetical protein
MKFYFHTRDGRAFLQDEAGAELADLDAARREATLAAREMVAELVLAGKVIDGQQFEIADKDGTLLAVIPYKSVLNLK